MDGQGYNNYYRAASGGGHPRNNYHQQTQQNGYYNQSAAAATHYNNRIQNPRYNNHSAPQQSRQQQQHVSHTSPPPPYVPFLQYHYQAAQTAAPQQVATQFTPQYTLSADAQPFVPSFLMPRDHQFGGAGGAECYNDSYDGGLNSSYDEDNDALLQLQTFITDVSLSPGLFETMVQDLAEVICKDLKRSPQNTEQIVSTISQAGLLNQNFRYSAARLCDYLTTVVKVQGRPIFRDQLLDFLYKSVTSAKQVVGDKERDKDVRGLALFCVELFSQLDLGYATELPKAYENIGVLFADILRALILSNEKENQKNGAQALKLGGGVLERLCKGTDKMDILLADCKMIEEQEGVDKTIKLLLGRIPVLRKQNWGYTPKVKVAPEYGHSQVDANEMPVMYGPDGVPITAEELGFLSAGSNDAVAGGDFSEASQFETTPGMDDEALEAFDEFLKASGQI